MHQPKIQRWEKPEQILLLLNSFHVLVINSNCKYIPSLFIFYMFRGFRKICDGVGVEKLMEGGAECVEVYLIQLIILNYWRWFILWLDCFV